MIKQLRIPFHGTKIEANSRNAVPNNSMEEKTTQNETRQPKSSLFSYFGCFVKLIISTEFRFFPSFGIVSSAELGMPILPRKNGNRSESIPLNFFGTEFRSHPYQPYMDVKNV
jgi:hypothetical protein